LKLYKLSIIPPGKTHHPFLPEKGKTIKSIQVLQIAFRTQQYQADLNFSVYPAGGVHINALKKEIKPVKEIVDSMIFLRPWLGAPSSICAAIDG
jgi:hypothetical protein